VIVQYHPHRYLVHYYTLNDDLTTMKFEWAKSSYVSWIYTGQARKLFPIRKFEYDTRTTKFSVCLHTTTYEYASIYHRDKYQWTIRRIPLLVNADDRFEFKSRYYTNRTFLVQLRIIDNRFRIIGHPIDEYSWHLQGYFRHDHFNGTLVLSPVASFFSLKCHIGSSFHLFTGQYVQLIPHTDPQLAVEIFWNNYFHLAIQYAGLESLIAMKFIVPSSNIHYQCSLNAINETFFRIHIQFNTFISQNWTLKIDNEHFYLYRHDYNAYTWHVSVKDFTFEHRLNRRRTSITYNNDTIEFLADQFGFVIGNRSTDTSRYIHIYHRISKQNLTIYYYKAGRFSFDNDNIQTPIYDITMIYYPVDDHRRYVKILVELLPLQMSAFNLVRGRSFRFGYQTQYKQLILAGNLAFGLDDFDRRTHITMNERWKLSYGYARNERIYLTWNMHIDSIQQ
jgi:hypothetical protein